MECGLSDPISNNRTLLELDNFITMTCTSTYHSQFLQITPILIAFDIFIQQTISQCSEYCDKAFNFILNKKKHIEDLHRLYSSSCTANQCLHLKQNKKNHFMIDVSMGMVNDLKNVII